MKNGYTIHAVAFQDGSLWVAQCLEHDIATQASTLDGLLYELQRILVAHVFIARDNKLEPFDSIPKAPQRFWDLYRQAKTKVQPVRPSDLPLPEEFRPELEVRAA